MLLAVAWALSTGMRLIGRDNNRVILYVPITMAALPDRISIEFV
jgi:hypothetical protein